MFGYVPSADRVVPSAGGRRDRAGCGCRATPVDSRTELIIGKSRIYGWRILGLPMINLGGVGGEGLVSGRVGGEKGSAVVGEESVIALGAQ